MPRVKVNNIECYYEIHGAGRPLLLIAGLASDSQSWQPVLKGLAQRFKVIVFDNRGIGRTRYRKGKFQVSTLALDAVCLLDKLGVEKADILGHSMGGCIAQEIAIGHPGRVNRLILASTCASVSQKDKSVFRGLLDILTSNKGYELFIRQFFQLIFTPKYLSNRQKVEAAIKYALDYPYPVTAEGFRLQLEALEGFDSSEKLTRIRPRALIMAADKDRLVSVKESYLLADKIPSAKIVYIKGAGHSFQVEQPNFFVNRVVKFLQ